MRRPSLIDKSTRAPPAVHINMDVIDLFGNIDFLLLSTGKSLVLIGGKFRRFFALLILIQLAAKSESR